MQTAETAKSWKFEKFSKFGAQTKRWWRRRVKKLWAKRTDQKNPTATRPVFWAPASAILVFSFLRITITG